MTTTDVLTQLIERIGRRFDPDRIVLFGSRARGDNRPDSDYDLLVVLPECANKRQTTIAILTEVDGVPASVDIVVTTPDEIARRGDVIGTVLRPALRDGRTVYERR